MTSDLDMWHDVLSLPNRWQVCRSKSYVTVTVQGHWRKNVLFLSESESEIGRTRHGAVWAATEKQT